MSRRGLLRRRFDQSSRERLIDDAFARYLDWLVESEAVKDAYGAWSRAPRTDGALPFAAYGAALDREESAATAYRSVIAQIEEAFGGRQRRADPRPGPSPQSVGHPASG
ncbi:MAG TPA: hypothetical protein VNV44_13410 [Solirubrobacteraceae bacterium]|nr:hypothetical protein [Solirubrobacteraceae bacterium]